MPGPIRPDLLPGIRAIDRLPDQLRAAPGGASFGDLFQKAINDASGLEQDSRSMIEAFLRGEPVELHQVMAASEEASISLELLVEIRNKLTEAYRSIMNLQ
jgi:flagellar hook-basal body complex protein FliE